MSIIDDSNPHLPEQDVVRDQVPEAEVADLEQPAQGAETVPAQRCLPDHFRDSVSGEIRTEALIDAYLDLEQRLEERPARELPASPDDYAIELETDAFVVDADVNRKLHEAGFDQAQAQLVYDLAATHLLPMVAEVASAYEAEGQIGRLRQDFGGDEQWREVSRQIKVWGESNLSADAFAVLANTREGVLAMHKMMSGGEPTLLGNNGEAKSLPTESELKQMMHDPRYWRDQDKSFVEKVREGFRQLYDT